MKLMMTNKIGTSVPENGLVIHSMHEDMEPGLFRPGELETSNSSNCRQPQKFWPRSSGLVLRRMRTIRGACRRGSGVESTNVSRGEWHWRVGSPGQRIHTTQVSWLKIFMNRSLVVFLSGTSSKGNRHICKFL